MDAAFVRELYKRELDEKLALDTRPTFHAISLTSAVGVIAWSYGTMPAGPMWLRLIWASCLLLSFASFTRAAWRCLVYMTGFVYEKIAVPTLLRDHYDSLKEFLENNPCDTTELSETFAGDVESRMIEATTVNAIANARRSELHVTIIRTLVVGTLLAGSPPLLHESWQCVNTFIRSIKESNNRHVEAKAPRSTTATASSDEQRPAATAE